MAEAKELTATGRVKKSISDLIAYHFLLPELDGGNNDGQRTKSRCRFHMAARDRAGIHVKTQIHDE